MSKELLLPFLTLCRGVKTVIYFPEVCEQQSLTTGNHSRRGLLVLMSTFCITASVEEPEPADPHSVSADLGLCTGVCRVHTHCISLLAFSDKGTQYKQRNYSKTKLRVRQRFGNLSAEVCAEY